MIRIALIGAGSVVFGKNVIADVLWHDALKGCELRLMDIDRERLDTAAAMATLINRDLEGGARILKTLDRRQALDGADVVICTINVGGFDATVIDHAVPRRFGVCQTVGDTLGPGGIFRAARNVPEVLRLCDDMAALCPRALLVNYSNPMAMHCLAIERSRPTLHVGLCHGVQNTAHVMRSLVGMLANKVTARAVGVHLARPWNSRERVREWLEWMAMGEDPAVSYTCAGINHMAFFLRFQSGDRDLYPALRAVLDVPHLRRLDAVRMDLFERLGYFMTETSGHTAEYVPYYLKSPAEIVAKGLRVSSYLRTCRDQDKSYRHLRQQVLAGRSVIDRPYTPSVEHISRIINALVTGRPYVFNGNVHNTGSSLIANLPGDACVEVPCTADKAGVTPHRIGELPPACAALIRTNINVQDLAVRGILEGRRDYIMQALMLDPNTASQIAPSRIWAMGEAMIKAQARWLPKGF